MDDKNEKSQEEVKPPRDAKPKRRIGIGYTQDIHRGTKREKQRTS